MTNEQISAPHAPKAAACLHLSDELTIYHKPGAPNPRFSPVARRLLRLWMMLKKIGRLFVIKTRLEACLIIYALAVGAMARGAAYLLEYPGYVGKVLLLASPGSVFLAGSTIFDSMRCEPATEAARPA